MKLSKTTTALCVALAAAAGLSTDVAAKSFAAGSACASQKDGNALKGTVFVTFTQQSEGAPQPLCGQPTTVEAMIRVSHGNDLKTYVTEVSVPNDVCNPCTVMDALLQEESLIEQIKADFCSTSSCTIGVREISSPVNDVETSTSDPTVRYRTLADVVITARD